MKAKSTIRKQIHRLAKFLESNPPKDMADRAYEAQQALNWVILGDCSWTPASVLEKELDDLISEPRR